MKIFKVVSFLLGLGLQVAIVYSQEATDSIQDADGLQSGYLSNHKMDPAIVNSANFGLLWMTLTGGSIPGSTVAEQFLAKPLVYTPTTRSQVVIAVSETNWVYLLDAATGVIVKKRQVRPPFDGVTDLPCADIKGTTGITGTPVVERKTNTMYFFAKGYRGTARGFSNGAYFFYAVDALTLEDRTGYPILVDGNPADNSPEKYFHGGTHLQRTALSMIGNTVYGGFGGICDSYNFTGYIVGVDKQSSMIRAIFATISGPDSIPQNGTWQGGGGEAGIWQCGRSFASDRAGRFFVAVSNGLLLGNYASPLAGSSPPQILEGAIVNMRVDPTTGKLSAQDFFRPFDYSTMADATRDIGSGGVTMLDPDSFQTATVKRLGLVGGKGGKVYLIDIDNLGGYKNGPGQTDAVVQTVIMPSTGSQPGPPYGGIFGAIGSYPIPGGGYIYVKPTTISGSTILSKIYVYKFHQENGTMSEVAQSNDTTPSYIGTGAPTVTSMDGLAGTGIVWITTRDGELNAYRAIPNSPGRSDPKDPFESASKQFFDSLATEEKEIFKATTLAEQVLKEAQLADEASKDRTSRKFANKLKPFVAGIEQYGAALDIMSNTNSLILCPLWGGIRVILHLAREFGDYFGRITTMLEQIGYNLSRLKRYPRLYPNNTDLGQAMAHVYRHIFLFCEKAKVAFGEGKRKKNKSFDFTGLRVAMKLIWKPFKEQFEETQQSIAMYVDIIEKEVSIAEKEEAHKERIKAEAERQTQALRWEKTEENNKSLEEHHAKIDYFLDEQSIRKVYEWLSPADVEVNHAVASKLRHSHTGEWFLSGKEFKGWLTGDYKFLWLYAIPGAGKTILLSTIVNYLKENVKSHSDKVGLAYFYCDYKDVQKQCPTRTLGTLLAMLGAQNKGVFHELKTFFEKQRKENLSYTPSFDELRSQLLLVSTSRFFSQILIVIDALDECDDREFLMDALLELSNETSGCIKVLVTSRSEPDIHSIFSKMPNVCIRKDDVSADVESYITSEVKSRIQSKKLKLRDPNLEQEITTALAEKADGMFQWVKCQIYQLCTMKSDKTIRAALLKLPKTLEDTYVRILQRLEREYEEDIGNVQKILWWLVKGVRTLTLDELAEALSIDPDDEDSTAMDFDAVWTDPDDILVLCGSLVTVSPDRTKVALAHYSVKEFLVSSRVLEILPGFYMGGIEIEASIAKICLTYLCFEDFQDGPLSDSTELGQRLEKYHFLKYAAQSWATHFRRYGNGNDDKALFDLTLRLLRVESGNFTSWRQIYQSRGNFRQGTSRDFQPLYYASLFGLPGAVKALVASGIDSDIGGVENGKALRAAALEGHLEVVEILLESCDIQSNHGKGGNALYAAASRGHDKIVQLLLDRGAEIESHKGKHGTALLVAALEGHKSVVQLLLARGANTAVVNKRYGTPLSAAAEKGHESILRVLLQHGVDVNARGGWYGHPLVFAVVGNNEKIVQLLVDNGADVDAKGGKHQTGLITAATLGNLQIMKMLVGRGVEVNDFNDKTGDALYAAASAGHVEIVKFLLDSGADVNAKGGKNRNALNAACAEGHQEIVRQLLDCGAYANAIDEHCGGAVHIAALNGHPELVRMLVKAGADLNAEGGIHRTTLQAAGITGRADMVQLVIDLGVPSGDNDNMSAALVLAACNSHKDAIRLLVELGADINAFNLTKSNDYWSPLQVAAYEGDAEVVQLLLDLGADVNLKGGTHGTPLLAFLAGPVDPVDMPEVLLRAGADVSIGGGSEYGTPLAVAAHRGYVKGVRLFLENGADANQIRVRYKETENQKTTWYFETALQYAIESETEEAEEIVKLLIEGGADINLAICTDPTNGMGCADALQSAAGVGNERLVRKLVELGAKLEFDSSGPRCYYNSALQAAAATGNTDIMRVLIELGSDVNAPGGAVGTALAVAALEGQCDAITLLLDSGADVNACTTGRYGTALQAGAYCGETELVSLLVQRGADINQFAKGSHYGYALIAATFSEYTEIISLLIELGADVNVQNPHPSRYFTALHAAADTGNYENTTLLIKHGADVNACGGRSGTALTAAYGHAWYLLVDQLLDHGALSDLRGGYYGTAVCAGIQQSSDNLFYHMLRNGTIDPNIDCGRWGNPLATAVFFRDGQYLADKFLDLEEVDVNGRPGIYGTALHGACRNGRKELVERLLKRGADINACAGKYWTPVIAAVAGGDLELVKLLVEKGANIHTIGRSGTAIHFAASGKSLDIVTFLLDHGADINVKAGKYSTVLQVASLNGHRDIAQLLIEKGAEVNAKGGRFGTALAAASLAGHLEVVDLLLENGAEVNIIGGRYGNALQSAVINSREELAEMLVEKGAKPQADQGWWKNAPFSMRRNAEGLARRLLGIGGNEHTDSTKTAGTNDVRPADSDLSNSFL